MSTEDSKALEEEEERASDQQQASGSAPDLPEPELEPKADSSGEGGKEVEEAEVHVWTVPCVILSLCMYCCCCYFWGGGGGRGGKIADL